MQIGIISSTIYNGSSVSDTAMTLAEYMAHSGCSRVRFNEGAELRDGTQVFGYKGKELIVTVFDESREDYNVGDIVLKDCKLMQITAKDGTASHVENIRAKEPEEYGAWDEDIDFRKWTHRYFRLKMSWLEGQCIGIIGTVLNRQYYMYHDRCYDTWVFTAKDQNVPYCNPKSYMRTILKSATTNKFDHGTDFKAIVQKWGAPNAPRVDTMNVKNMIIRGGYAYFRTHLDKPVEYVTKSYGSTIKYGLSVVVSPADIPGFRFKRNIAPLAVFDGKGYTKVSEYPEDGKITFSFYNTAPVDNVTFGQIVCERITVSVSDQDGTRIESIANYPVKNELSKAGYDQPVTVPLYLHNRVDKECRFDVTIYGSYVELGDIVVSDTLDFGYTNLEFSNEFKNFSTLEQDQWGTIEYVRRVNVKRHRATVDLKVSDYDMIMREMAKVGYDEVVINGSDSLKNRPTDSIRIFQATMMIGRIKDFKIATKSKGNKIDDVATYSMTVEERV